MRSTSPRLLPALFLCLTTATGVARAEGFDWGSGASAGSGRFEQQIARDAVVTIGDIPAGRVNPSVTLRATEDLDIQLFDGAVALVRWPDGRLNGPRQQSIAVGSMRVSWSGYDGDGTGLGNEWIRVEGTTDRPLTMKVYGYRAGQVEVTYRWDANPAAAPAASGSGSFRQAIARDRTVTIGDIPAGLEGVAIDLASDADLDIQLYDGATKIVRWPDGILAGAGAQATTYHGMRIEWSGYDGRGGRPGDESIRIVGRTSRRLTMKVFGYQAGFADVRYRWGASAPVVTPTDLASLDLTVKGRVRAVYFVPKDRAFRDRIQERLDHFVRIAQTFFRDEMRTNGFVQPSGDGKTFRFDAGADGRWRVVYMVGEHDAAWYQGQPNPAALDEGAGPGAAMAEMLRRLPEAFHRDNVTMYFYDLAVVEQGRVRHSGQGGSGAPWEGAGAGYVLQGAHFLGMGFDTVAPTLAEQSALFEQTASSGIEDWAADGTWRVLTRGEYASNMVGAAVHELGHAFYLGHLFTDDDGDGVETNLMGMGFRRFGGRFTSAGPRPATALGPDHARELDAALLFRP